MNQISNRAVLAIFDVSGIQPYIFSTSRLRENIGASIIVGHVLKSQLIEVIQDMGLRSSQLILNWDKRNSFDFISNSDIQVEIIYNGGGSAIIAFRSKNLYEEVNRRFARKLIETSYSLSFASACINTDFQNYAEDRHKLALALEQVKASMPRQKPAGGFPICEQEGLTGLPITHIDEETKQNVSTVQALKIRAARQGMPVSINGVDRREHFHLPNELIKEYVYAYEMSELELEKGDDSYVAVVHIDGNGMGAQLQRLVRDLSILDYEQAVIRMRRLSHIISQGYVERYDACLVNLAKRLKEKSDSLNLKSLNNKKILPLRPLIMDGDDLTFICTGRLGVPFAAALLRDLEQQELNKNDPNALSLSACAGVALVHGHFPFHLAYEIAESCCKNAKKKRLDDKAKAEQEPFSAAYLDFHLVRGSYVSEMENLRNTVYRDKGQFILQRPYRITAKPDYKLEDSYDRLDYLINQLPVSGEEGTATLPRSRLKRLYEAYLSGSHEEIDILVKESETRNVKLLINCSPTEELGEQLISFDALELMDLYDRRVYHSAEQLQVTGKESF